MEIVFSADESSISSDSCCNFPFTPMEVNSTSGDFKEAVSFGILKMVNSNRVSANANEGNEPVVCTGDWVYCVSEENIEVFQSGICINPPCVPISSPPSGVSARLHIWLLIIPSFTVCLDNELFRYLNFYEFSLEIQTFSIFTKVPQPLCSEKYKFLGVIKREKKSTVSI